MLIRHPISDKLPDLPGSIDFRSCDVAVHVDPARHHHQSGGIERAVRPSMPVRRRRDDLAVADPEIVDLAVNAASRVVNVAGRDF